MASSAAGDGTVTLQQSSRFFTIPPELRNSIYELALAPNISEFDINLKVAQAPSPAIALTCRQAFHESHLIYAEAFAAYWSGNTFIVNMMDRSAAPALQNLPTVTNAALKHVQRFDVLLDYGGYHVALTVKKQMGGWLVPTSVYYHSSFRFSSSQLAIVFPPMLQLIDAVREH